MAEINKVDANRYRIKSDGGIIWLSAQEMRDIADWCLLHMLEIEAEAMRADAIARNQAMELAPNEIEAEPPSHDDIHTVEAYRREYEAKQAEAARRYNAEMDARDHIIAESVEKPWLPLHDGE